MAADIDTLRRLSARLEDLGAGAYSSHIVSAVAEIQALRGVPVGANVGSKAARDVLAERLRQVEAEGWTPAHDDFHEEGELADAAACYAAGCIPMAPAAASSQGHGYTSLWPWEAKWWKPGGDRRRDLVKAGALILAEIERLDRASMKEGAR